MCEDYPNLRDEQSYHTGYAKSNYHFQLFTANYALITTLIQLYTVSYYKLQTIFSQ